MYFAHGSGRRQHPLHMPFWGLMAALLFIPLQAFGATYFVSPNGSDAGDGSRERPYGSVSAALAGGAVHAGDTLSLLPGKYGALKVANARFATPVTITSAPGGRARFDAIEVANSKNIIFDKLDVWPDRPNPEALFLVRSLTNAPKITFRNLDVRSSAKAKSYGNWRRREWNLAKTSGIFAQGDDNEISHSVVTGVYHGLMIEGRGSRLLNNKVYGISGDGMRALGDNSLVRGNWVQDCVTIDGNHADGFQTWSRGPGGAANQGTVRGLTIENNVIIEWLGSKRIGPECNMQGIFLGGYLEDLTIRNNVVSVSAYHGITGYGITDGKIINNTLTNNRGPSSKQPWIGVWGYKDRGSKRVTVANNVAPYFNVSGGIDGTSPRLRNVLLRYPTQELRDPFGGDFRPKMGSSLIDAANPLVAPPFDLDGTKRPLGKAPDLGAYEVR